MSKSELGEDAVIATEKTKLNIPFSDKDRARDIAGKLDTGESAIMWDKKEKTWFAKEGADLSKLKEWLPDENKIQQSLPPKKMFHQDVTDRIVDMLEKGTAPWQKPWGESNSSTLPMNPTTGQRYKGINTLQLMSQGYEDNRWMTYKQAQDLGGQVRKGEKGTQIQYWQFKEQVNKLDDKGQPIKNELGQNVKEEITLDKPKAYLATVFNVSQIDNLPAEKIAISETGKWSNIERAEAILKNSGAKITHKEGQNPVYSPYRDEILLPSKEQFPTADNYYSTALHELGHWTGHKDRLNRDLNHKFGTEGYAKEELRAEISSMITGEELKIGRDPEQHAAYVKSWISVLKNDPYELSRAAADAEKIHSHVMKFDQKIELKEDIKQTQSVKTIKSEAASNVAAAPKTEDKPKKTVKQKVSQVEKFKAKVEKVKTTQKQTPKKAIGF